MNEFRCNTIEEALEDFKQGKMVIVVDDGDVENDGALVWQVSLPRQRQ